MAKKCCGVVCDRENIPCNDLKIALVGNPNAGKTTLFNKLTGSHQSTGNWPGVTVERKQGYFSYNDQDIHVIDLPGTYSLDYSDASEDEIIARKFCLDCPEHIFVNILDASTLERGLYLTLQLRELGIPTLVYLNMIDVANKRGMKINVEELSQQLDCPVIPISLKEGQSSAQIQTQLIKESQTIHNAEALAL